jgi:hypothetical protein
MSLNRLPTELDSKIAGYLVIHKRSLSSFSKVSKYYQSVTEPLLYQKLKFRGDDWEALILLMLTLVRRERLALHIKSLKIDHGYQRDHAPREDNVVESAVGARLWTEGAGVHNKINEIVQAALRNKADACYELTQLHSKLFEDYGLYPALALILCLAENITALSICEQGNRPRPSIWNFISLPWAQFRPKILGSLKYLSICGCYNEGIFGSGPTILPSMTTLKVSNCSFGQAGLNYLFHDRVFAVPVSIPSPQIKRIQKLILTEVFIAPKSIMVFIDSPWFVNLKQLRVTKCKPYRSDHHIHWNMQGLIEALEQYTPNLEVFEWTGGEYIDTPPVFGNFSNLQHLRKLYLDIDLKTPIPNPGTHVLDVFSWLPPNLLRLKFNNITCRELDYAVDLVYKRIAHVEDKDTYAIEVFKSLASMFPCKHLDLYVRMEEYNNTIHAVQPRELDPRTVRFLCLVSKALNVRDIRLRVWSMHGSWQKYLELLIQGDYTAPALQSQAPAENGS